MFSGNIYNNNMDKIIHVLKEIYEYFVSVLSISCSFIHGNPKFSTLILDILSN